MLPVRYSGATAPPSNQAEMPSAVGWKFHAGGGLGARPYLAKVIFDWVPEERVLDVARATVEAFRRHGNRRVRAQARLKVVVDAMGAEKFGGLLLDILRERGIQGLEKIEPAKDPVPTIGRMSLNGEAVVPQKAAGKSIVRILVPRSELQTADSRALSRLADGLGGGTLVFTNRQNVELHDVPNENIDALLAALHGAGFRTEGHEHLRAPYGHHRPGTDHLSRSLGDVCTCLAIGAALGHCVDKLSQNLRRDQGCLSCCL